MREAQERALAAFNNYSMTSSYSRSLLLHASILLVCTASVAAAQRTSTEPRTVLAIYPQYPGDTSGKPRYVNVSVTGDAPGRRLFELATDEPQREGDPRQRTIQERTDAPFVVTGGPFCCAPATLAMLNKATALAT